ncbi:hypothetical protein [Kitasatospora sp. NPDC004531]
MRDEVVELTDTRRAYAASMTRIRAEAGEKPRPEDVPLLAFDLYLPGDVCG